MTRSGLRFGTWFTACCAIAASLACGAVLADPPGRAARLAQISGAVSFSPAGEDDWVLAQLNRPLVTGDRLWSDLRRIHSRTEDLEAVARVVAQQALRHLAAGGVSGTENQDPFWFIHVQATRRMLPPLPLPVTALR